MRRPHRPRFFRLKAFAMLSLALSSVLAQAAGGGYSQIFFLLVIVVVFYLMLIRPQQRKAKQHQELVKSIGTGDVIVTIGGIHGTVHTIDDETVRIEVAPGTVITMARAAVARRLVDSDAGDDVAQTSADPTGSDTTDTP
jgi:preprotein translocase subunit YajC